MTDTEKMERYRELVRRFALATLGQGAVDADPDMPEEDMDSILLLAEQQQSESTRIQALETALGMACVEKEAMWAEMHRAIEKLRSVARAAAVVCVCVVSAYPDDVDRIERLRAALQTSAPDVLAQEGEF